MKQLTCEMCGSPNIIKQDGLFVCQNCGTKYSIEEARKLMIEGPVDVSGSTVNINNSDRLSNLYQVARRFRDENNAANAEKYYSMILEEDPNSWEASFYVVYFRALSCKIAEIATAANSVKNSLKSVMWLIASYVPYEKKTEVVNEVVYRCKYISTFLFSAAIKSYHDIDFSIRSNFYVEHQSRMQSARNIMYMCGDLVDNCFAGSNTEVAKIADIAWKEGIALHNVYINELKGMYGNFVNVKDDLSVID